MSAVKAYMEDAIVARTRAWEAAQFPTSCERLRAITATFQDLGDLSSRYADPQAVVRLLVKEAAETYTRARTYQRWETAA